MQKFKWLLGIKPPVLNDSLKISDINIHIPYHEIWYSKSITYLFKVKYSCRISLSFIEYVFIDFAHKIRCLNIVFILFAKAEVENKTLLIL